MERICPSCKRSDLRRSSRQGFLESLVYSVVGLYPWRCRHCGKRTMLRDRGEPRRSSRRAGARV